MKRLPILIFIFNILLIDISLSQGYDLSPATAAKFREWLKEKYGDLKTQGNT